VDWSGPTILLGILLIVGLVLYLIYRWISTHPEKIRRTAARLGGGRLQTFLASPVGLWFLRRFAPGEVYGLAFTVGLLFTGLFSWAFSGIVEDLFSRAPLVDVALAVLRFVYSHGDPSLTTGVVVFEAVFSPEVLLLAGAAAGGLLLLLGWRGREPQNLFSGIVLLAAAFGTGSSSNSLNSSSTGLARRLPCNSSPKQG
jgi:hypothetical protein